MIRYVAIVTGGAAVIALLFFGASKLTAVSYELPDVPAAIESVSETVAQATDDRKIIRHQPLPDEVRTIYMTSCVAGTPSFRDDLVALIDETEINSVIIDIKDYSGTISFPPDSDAWRPAWQAAKCGTSDMEEFIAELHEKGIFVIGRITVFQDPFYTQSRPDLAVKRADGVSVWKDHKGLSFIDVGAQAYWDHIIELATLSYNIGFDELNFDYIRYPSDGPMSDIAFTHSKEFPGDDMMQANLESFFVYLHEKMTEPETFAAVRHENTGREEAIPWTSADLFGMTTTNYDDLSIGQVQDRTAPYFDFIAPMVYPSHYPKNSFGYGNPNDYPYEIVHYAMKTGVERMASETTPMQGFLHERIGTTTPAVYKKPAYSADKFRTWIQDFDYGGDYDAADVRAQIQASYDAGVRSFMIWAPSNRYTRGALKVE